MAVGINMAANWSESVTSKPCSGNVAFLRIDP